MRFRRLLVVAAAGAATACQQEQQLPFSVANQAPVEKTITTTGGTVSTPAGSAVIFPSGALASTTPVSVQTGAPSARLAAFGPASSKAATTISPAGQTLAVPASFETRLDAGN